MKILMVCLGNICRSPLAEGILRHQVEQQGLDWEIDSAGTGAYHIGNAPHKLSQKVALLNGVDISSQCARQFRKEDMLEFDRIYVMDAENYQEVKRMSKELWDPSKTDLLLNALEPGKNRGVPDPWYGEEDGYHSVFDMISQACDKIIQKSKVKSKNNL
jgi:protein-tyrosine phosphatase